MNELSRGERFFRCCELVKRNGTSNPAATGGAGAGGAGGPGALAGAGGGGGGGGAAERAGAGAAGAAGAAGVDIAEEEDRALFGAGLETAEGGEEARDTSRVPA
jgi:hypothetical protein